MTAGIERRLSVTRRCSVFGCVLLQRPGDRHGGQPGLHLPAAIPGGRHGVGHHRSGRPGHRIR